ncbi:hypothetical protein MPSI1_003863 [Malassezia psittaci]|uniref:Ribonuclease H2 subunit B n=1 Tax=Malassezia psittaci TaxID=1821823 RepID=A0AAF0FD40_9BASI|nr:hypothetical protein MPSI1_003863 [Malassezia psittaci]
MDLSECIPVVHPDIEKERIFTLPHPRTHIPSYYVMDQSHTRTYEMLVVRPEPPQARSWFVGSAEDASQKSSLPGTVLKDGGLRLFSPIDPFFIVIGLIAEVESKHYCPLEDLSEAAAELHARRRAQTLAKDVDTQHLDLWPDIVPFLLQDSIKPHLKRICDTQDDPSIGSVIYRLNWDKILGEFQAKCARLTCSSLLDSAPETIGRQVRKRLANAHTATPSEWQEAQTKVAYDTIQGYVAQWIMDRWRNTTKDA